MTLSLAAGDVTNFERHPTYSHHILYIPRVCTSAIHGVTELELRYCAVLLEAPHKLVRFLDVSVDQSIAGRSLHPSIEMRLV